MTWFFDMAMRICLNQMHFDNIVKSSDNDFLFINESDKELLVDLHYFLESTAEWNQEQYPVWSESWAWDELVATKRVAPMGLDGED